MKEKIAYFLDFISDFFIIIGVVLLLQQFVFTVGQVQGTSMETTLTGGQKVVVDRVTYRLTDPQRFDIVAVRFPGESYWIKRVVGLPGEKIEYRNNQLYVNGTKVDEPFLNTTVTTVDFSTTSFFPETNGVIPEGNYLVLGDNRDRSKDGRMMGTLTKKEILGIARFSLYPLDRIGVLENRYK